MKLQRHKLVLIVMALLLTSTPCFGKTYKGPMLWLSQYEWFSFFQFGALAGYRNKDEYAVGPQLSWNPTVILASFVAFRGDVGMSLLGSKERNIKETFGHLQGFLSFPFDSGFVELGGGVQKIFGALGGSSPIASLNLVVPLLPKSCFILDRVYFGYSAFFHTSRLLHEARLGIGVAF